MHLETILKKNHLLIGLLCIIVSVGTWYVDIIELVEVCPYCRVERSIIGLLGLMMLLPKIDSIFLKITAYQLGFVGAVVASEQVFLKFKEGIMPDHFTLFAYCALGIIIVQVYLLNSHLSTKE